MDETIITFKKKQEQDVFFPFFFYASSLNRFIVIGVADIFIVSHSSQKTHNKSIVTHLHTI